MEGMKRPKDMTARGTGLRTRNSNRRRLPQLGETGTPPRRDDTPHRIDDRTRRR